ncbi:pheromone processing carboxypeptidase (Sxa2) [Venturia nashicola]|uniref:Pheromone processing carboxypeptidase (Sxa2) n=1 Tax=Venturia nashicola TaxID=86259 RepID=A0A4Z1PQY0_9PEZI|nr:pheromone processing carboxypeptidase (Sxa2) [Venturia nashicola]
MYAGEIPIKAGDNSRELFFVFQPTIGAPVDEITIWLNGGPGCSSLAGFFQENGRFLWTAGSKAPYINENSWVNLTNMLWVEQPVGTGYTVGTPTAKSEEEIANDFVGFLENFENTFGIKNFKIYVTGYAISEFTDKPGLGADIKFSESYAGRFVPYISAAILNKNNTALFNLKGALVYDPCIGQFDNVQQQVPAVPFVQANQQSFNFGSSFLSDIESLHKSCGYETFITKYLKFPPPGLQPQMTGPSSQCDVFTKIKTEARKVNPCFNIYEVNQTCPTLSDQLNGLAPYFDRADVKTALHAPSNSQWSVCSDNPVFTGGNAGPEHQGDVSLDSIQQVLPQVIAATNRVLVANGNYDMVIVTNGTLLSIQNMTWGGALGFQSPPVTPINIPGQGEMGLQHYERGLMWAETYKCGHMVPEYQPLVAYRHLQWLLGKIETL